MSNKDDVKVTFGGTPAEAKPLRPKPTHYVHVDELPFIKQSEEDDSSDEELTDLDTATSAHADRAYVDAAIKDSLVLNELADNMAEEIEHQCCGNCEGDCDEGECGSEADFAFGEAVVNQQVTHIPNLWMRHMEANGKRIVLDPVISMTTRGDAHSVTFISAEGVLLADVSGLGFHETHGYSLMMGDPQRLFPEHKYVVEYSALTGSAIVHER